MLGCRPRVLVTLGLCLVGCATKSVRQDPIAPEPPLDYTIPDLRGAGLHIAVFRRLFSIEHIAASKSPGFYIELVDADPSVTVLAAFAEHTPPVFAASKWTDEGGIRFWIGEIKIVAQGVVEVTAGYTSGNQGRGIWALRVEDRGGMWVVTEERLIGQS